MMKITDEQMALVVARLEEFIIEVLGQDTGYVIAVVKSNNEENKIDAQWSTNLYTMEQASFVAEYVKKDADERHARGVDVMDGIPTGNC